MVGVLYIIVLVSSFLMGRYDNGDMTFFVFWLIGGIIAGADKLIEEICFLRKKGRVRKNVNM